MLLEKHPEIGEDLEALLLTWNKFQQIFVKHLLTMVVDTLITHFSGNSCLRKQEPTAEVAAAINEAFGSFEASKKLQQQQQLVLFRLGMACC